MQFVLITDTWALNNLKTGVHTDILSV